MKKGIIILSGGGDINQTFCLDEKFFSLLSSHSRILYIPTAMDLTLFQAESCYHWFSSLISMHVKNDKEVDFTMLNESDLIPDLNLFNSIYLGGGNTYKLLEYIINNGLDKKIREFILNGGIVYGGSAGAMILGKDIRTFEHENDKNYINCQGLNLLKDASISCHYSDIKDEELLIVANKIKSNILALPEESGIIFDGVGDIIEKVGDVFSFDTIKTKL